MKRVILITIYSKRLLINLSLLLFIFIVVVLIKNSLLFNNLSQVFSINQEDTLMSLEEILESQEDTLKSLEKENSTLINLFSSLIPKDRKVISEDEYRNIFKNAGVNPPQPIATFPLSKVISEGTEKKFVVLTDESEYLRPVYVPYWKMTYYRGWLYLDNKNIEARHRIFAFSIGGSMNYDISGSLGLNLKKAPIVQMDNHHNINLLVYDFIVKNVKVYNNQVALIGEPRRTGVQIVSIVQNDLLPEGVNTKDFVFQLSTPGGYEVDYLHYNIIQYEYLKKQIEEHTVKPTFAQEIDATSLEKLILENEALKAELSYFIPLENTLINQEVCDEFKNNDGKDNSLSYATQHGKAVPFNFIYNNPKYKRPLYDPSWKINYKRNWCYIPDQIELNLHRLHIIPQTKEQQYDFWGKLAFHEQLQPIKSDQKGFLVYNFIISKVINYKNQLFFIGSTSRTGAQLITLKPNDLKTYDAYIVRLLTPDNAEIDCTTFR